jgi:hypothetical protein
MGRQRRLGELSSRLPRRKIAVVILINSSHGRMVAREVAAKALGE